MLKSPCSDKTLDTHGKIGDLMFIPNMVFDDLSFHNYHTVTMLCDTHRMFHQDAYVHVH